MDAGSQGHEGGADRDCDVLVIGAGPTGLALAVALRQYGVRAVVVEKESSAKREARACVIWQRALEVLRDLGCVDRFLDGGLALRQADIYVQGRRVGRHEMTVPGSAFARPLSIEQDDIEQLLGDRLRELGEDVRWRTEAVAVRVHTDRVEVDLKGPEGAEQALVCRWLVGCEGAHSIVRKTLDIPFEGERRPNLQAVQLNAEPDWRFRYATDLTYFFLEQGVSQIASPLPRGGYRFFSFCTDPDPGVEKPPGVEEMRELVARAAHDPDMRLTATEPLWTNRARFHDRVAGTLRRGRAMLAGDSGHLWAPIGGHGLNTGLRGAHNLGWKLAAVHRGWAVPELLDTYSREQRRTAQHVMRDMRHNVLELPPTRVTLAAMRVLGPAVLASERAGRRARIALSDFARDHRASELSRWVRGGSRLRHWLRAGDRLPDLPVIVAGGRRRGLHDLLSYQRWTLLVLPEAGLGDAEFAELTSRYAVPVGVFRVAPGPGHGVGAWRSGLPKAALLLVRPDGHIGLRVDAGGSGALTALQAYFARWFVLSSGEPGADGPGA